ncbi:MAG: hypoxanthine phosphoribosyltransferase [Pseudomonadota bacterium]
MSIEVREILFDAETIDDKVAELAEQISSDYRDAGHLVLVGVLKGSFIFLADLARKLTIDRTVEFIAVSSYDGATSGAVRMIMDMRGNIAGKHVVIVEDIIDTGNTLKYLIETLNSRHPASIRTCAFLHKTEATVVDIPVDYVGFSVGEEWVVGYGLDYDEFGRTLPYIGTIDPQD